MSSLLYYIRQQVISDLETTSLEKAYDGYISSSRQYPYAQVAIVSSGLNLNITETYERIYVMNIFISGTTADQVEGCMQEIHKLWMSNDGMAALRGMGVITINPTGATSAWPMVSATSETFEGTIDFEIVVEYHSTS